MKDVFIRRFKRLIKEQVGCSIQHDGCPCNTCFHSFAEDELGLQPTLAHMFWIVNLALRGDYKQDEILEWNKDFIDELYKAQHKK